MYIHGFIDGALTAVVLGLIALVVVAVVYSKKKMSNSMIAGRR